MADTITNPIPTTPTAAKNANLGAARKAKNDEFYTQFDDIVREVNAYLEFDPDRFRGKTVLLPCDDPTWSSFTKYFALRFTELGLARLISTSYAPGSNQTWINNPAGYIPPEIEKNSPRYDEAKSWSRGKYFELLPEDLNGDGQINIEDLRWRYLDGDGDFRSEEVTALRDESDFVLTNPPFSLFREFIGWLDAGRQKTGLRFSVIGNKNSITYKEIFPLIRDNKIWVGNAPMGTDMLFTVPPEDAEHLLANEKPGSKYRVVNDRVMARAPSCWFTNIDLAKRHELLQLLTMDRNRLLKGDKASYKNLYAQYDNYDAIEVPRVDAIPSDFDGVMGVPITFLDKYSPEQFKILGSQRWAKKQALLDAYIGHVDPPADDKKTTIDRKETYDRIFIRRR